MILIISSHNRQSRIDRSTSAETSRWAARTNDMFCVSRSRARGPGLSIYTARCRSRLGWWYDGYDDDPDRGYRRWHLLPVRLAKAQPCAVSPAGAARQPITLRVVLRVLWARPPRELVSAE